MVRFIDSDVLIIAQWVSILIPLIWIGWRYIEDDGYITTAGFVTLIVICNLIIAWSVYDDANFLYRVFFKDSTSTNEKESFITLLNYSPIVGGARLISILLIITYFREVAEEYRRFSKFAKILAILNITAAIPAALLVLF
ncbi:MAG: hypothetical protein R2824_16065 [Saprospiraceae bacterium]